MYFFHLFSVTRIIGQVAHVTLGCWDRKNNLVEIVLSLGDGHELLAARMLGLAQFAVGFAFALDSLSVSQQVEHAMSLTYQFLATFLQHLVHSHRLVSIHCLSRISTIDDGIEILHGICKRKN